MEREEYKIELKKLKKQFHEDNDRLDDDYLFNHTKLKEEYKKHKLAIKKPIKAKKYEERLIQKEKHRKLNEAPKRSVLEEIGNAITHGVGALLGIIFLILMILKASGPLSLASAIIYGTCFILQMLFSCLYHCFKYGSTVKRIFRRFDYSSIYLQIGGTFAPLFLIYMIDNMWGFSAGITLFSIQWAFIILGVSLVGIFGPGRARWIHFTLYFVLGWSGLIFIPDWIIHNLPLLGFILGGGIIYTLGMIPFGVLKKKSSAHFIWHFVVLAGAIMMWVGIYLFVF